MSLVLTAILSLVVIIWRDRRRLSHRLAARELDLQRSRQALRFLGRANGIANTTFMDPALLSTLIMLFNEHFPDLEANLVNLDEGGLAEQVYHDRGGRSQVLVSRLDRSDPVWQVLSRFSSAAAAEWRGPPVLPPDASGQLWLSSIPLFAEESLVGTLLLRTHRPLGEADRILVLDISSQLAAAIHGLRNRARSGRLREVFARAVDPRVMEHLLANPNDLGGASVNASVLFLDIRDFTSFAESQAPEYVVARLNVFFMKMEACVRSEGGLINKFTGDGFLALFGAPEYRGDHAVCAVRAAVAMVAELHGAEALPGEVPFRVGIGIASGPMVCGTIGSPSRLEFTVIGDAVNTASRIESMNRFFGSEILVTTATLDAARAFAAGPLVSRFLGPMKVKGKARQVDMHEILGSGDIALAPDKAAGVESFSPAVALFHQGRQGEAAAAFEAYLQAHPDDPAARHFLSSCRPA